MTTRRGDVTRNHVSCDGVGMAFASEPASSGIAQALNAGVAGFICATSRRNRLTSGDVGAKS